MQFNSTLKDPRDYSINGRFFSRLIRVARPYWTREGAWRSWLVLGMFISFTLFETAMGAKLSFLTKQMSDALVNREAVSYWNLFALMTLIGLLINHGLFSLLFDYLYGRLAVHWRAWLTADLVSRYLANRNYYRIEQDNDIDNVDQRIQQEVEPYCSMVSALPRTLIYSSTTVGVQGFILSMISPVLFYSVFTYGVFSAIVTWMIYRPLIRLNFDATVAEADLRYGVLHVRNHAETIALYRGEDAESRSVTGRLLHVIRIAYAKLRYILFMRSALSLVDVVWTMLPVLLLVPSYFVGDISFGVVMQGTASAALLLQGIQRFSSFLAVFAAAAPHVVRLSQIVEKVDAMAVASSASQGTISMHAGDVIRFDHLTLETPSGERTLLRDLTLDIVPGQHLLIMGQTGVGKSSLLRATAGLWRKGHGSITLPAPRDMLFLPQRPYMLLGSLREQILYPSADATISDDALQRLLDLVSLPDVARRHGGFDTMIDWSRVLSLGEQQRIGFARALACGARFVLLDEATSAVDIATEKRLYEALAQSGVTYVSVGHRTSLVAFHATVLELQAEGAWRVVTPEQGQQKALMINNGLAY